MAIEAANAAFFADPAALSGLKREAAAQTPEGVREVARQFESLFTSMLLKNMRAASLGDGMFDSSQTEFYQEMFDQQLAVELGKGRGLGLADMLVRQLMTNDVAVASADATAPTDAGRAAGQAASTTAATWTPGDAEEFVSAIRPAATAAARELGVDPDAVIAHAALETGWGRSAPGNNLFGIKASGGWEGGATTQSTQEFEGGRMQKVGARFRAYDSPEQSIRDYVGVLKSPRYAAARGTSGDVEAFARGLQQGGYATDPDYVSKLTKVVARLKGGDSLPIPNTSAT